jgi:hypothetical protein
MVSGLSARGGLGTVLNKMDSEQLEIHRPGQLELRTVLIRLWLIGVWGVAQVTPAQMPGTLDSTFIKGAGADGFIRVVTVQPDAKILVGGNFTGIRGSPSPMVARLNVMEPSIPASLRPFRPRFLRPAYTPLASRPTDRFWSEASSRRSEAPSELISRESNPMAMWIRALTL